MVFILMDAFFKQKRLEARNTLGAKTLATLKKTKKKKEEKVNQNEFSTVLTKTSFKSLGFMILNKPFHTCQLKCW